jgi:hypothetical protein
MMDEHCAWSAILGDREDVLEGLTDCWVGVEVLPPDSARPTTLAFDHSEEQSSQLGHGGTLAV